MPEFLSSFGMEYLILERLDVKGLYLPGPGLFASFLNFFSKNDSVLMLILKLGILGLIVGL